jgi:DNA-binding NarL/FixJ family response regulator
MLTQEHIHTDKIRILVADDHLLVREQLAARLRRESDLDVVGVSASSTQAWQDVLLYNPQVLLMDPMMRDGLGLATLRQVRAYWPDVVVVVLTAFVDTMLNMQFHNMGISHILVKGVLSLELLSELRTAARPLVKSC